MSRRAERRAHRERLLERYRGVATRWAGRYDDRANRWEFTGHDASGRPILRYYIDRRGFNERLEYIERTARRLVNHHNCPCGMCTNPRKLEKGRKARLGRWWKVALKSLVD